MKYHTPVLAQEILKYLDVEYDKRYIDATLGDGGHTIEMLKKDAYVLGIDYDKESLGRALNRIKELGLEKRFIGVIGNFRDIEKIAQKQGFTEIDGILFDLGFSSAQLENIKGLSFQKDSALDMRLDKSLDVTAADLVNSLPAKHLEKLFFEYGEERYAKQFAQSIVLARKLKKFESTPDLVDVIVDSAPPGYDHGRIHPATRVFQALRIVVNSELENLKMSLPQAARLLKLPGGRVAIISFHSLEDRLAKNLAKDVRPAMNLLALTKVPILPGRSEIKKNRRARSAKLRIYEREKL